MMTLEEVWENLRQDPEVKTTMEEAEKSYKLFKKIENLIVSDLEAKLLEFAHRISDQNEEVLELKQQLAEKEQAIESLQEINQSLGQTCNNDAKEIERLREQLEEKEREETKRMQDFEKGCQEYYSSDKYKKDFAISEFEKVRSKIARLDVSPDESNRLIPALDNYTNGFHKSRFKIVNILDQQIKLLKGENENV